MVDSSSIRDCVEADIADMAAIINDAAAAYRGIIPADRWHEPYMPEDELRREIAGGVRFRGYAEAGELVGVMGVQPVADVVDDPENCLCVGEFSKDGREWKQIFGKKAITSEFPTHSAALEAFPASSHVHVAGHNVLMTLLTGPQNIFITPKYIIFLRLTFMYLIFLK